MGANMATPLPAKMKRADPQRSAHEVQPKGTCAPYASPIEKLHRAVGNRAMNSLLRSRVIQPKLTVSDPDDEYEREADRVADHVMRMPDDRSITIQQSGDVQHIALQPTLGSREIPTDLQNSPAVRMMTIEALQKRYDRIMQTLAQFDESTAETAVLDQQLVDISNELARRVALEQGRTFDQRVIDQMKAYLVENAKTEKDSCIICMNKGIQKLLEDPNQPLTPESVDATMELLRQSGRASQAREIGFNDRRGRLTRGGGRPHQLRESVSAAMLEMVGKDVGWSVFGMSLMDGLHSVLLTVDTHDPAQPRIHWSDQWKSKKGWKEYTREGLDGEITRLIQGWWDEQPEGKKHNLVVRLWRLRQ